MKQKQISTSVTKELQRTNKMVTKMYSLKILKYFYSKKSLFITAFNAINLKSSYNIYVYV